MSLLKVLILLPSVWLFNVAFMPPNTPPDKSERVYGAWHEHIFPTLFPLLHRLSASIPCIAELAILLVVNYPSVLSTNVTSHLVLSGQFPTSSINRYFLAGSVLAAIGSLGRLWCSRTLGRHFTHQLAVRKDHTLITAGPYSIVRHPGYLFATFNTMGMSFMIASPGSFTHRCGWLGTIFGRLVIGLWVVQNVLVWVIGCARCRIEDGFLREHFQEEWEGYSQRVKYRMIPGVY